MNSQNNDDSMNFSVIDKPSEAKAAADFSVGSILGQQQTAQPSNYPANLSMQKSVDDIFSKIRKIQVGNTRSILHIESKGSTDEQNFMKDLEKMQKQLSFESQPYNIYEQGASIDDNLINNKSKTQSCLKLTKESTNKSTNKSTSKEDGIILDQYFGPLILDFKKESKRYPFKNEYLKYSKNVLKCSSNSSNSHLSSDFDFSASNKKKKTTKSRSKDKIDSFFGRGKSKSSKNLLERGDFKKSKSKSITSKLRGSSKSHSNLKLSSEAQNHSSKVFTQYYGTDINVVPKKKTETKIKQELMTKIKSRQKSSKSKHKVILSPRMKGKVVKPGK